MIKICFRNNDDILISDVVCFYYNTRDDCYYYVGNGELDLKYNGKIPLRVAIKLSIHEIKLLKKYDIYENYKAC
jgi:hypothetical protein